MSQIKCSRSSFIEESIRHMIIYNKNMLRDTKYTICSDRLTKSRINSTRLILNLNYLYPEVER